MIPEVETLTLKLTLNVRELTAGLGVQEVRCYTSGPPLFWGGGGRNRSPEEGGGGRRRQHCGILWLDN